MKKYQKYYMPVITLALVLLLWEACVHVFNINLYILPPPSQIFVSIIENKDVLWMHSMVTLQEAIIGLIFAIMKYSI